MRRRLAILSLALLAAAACGDDPVAPRLTAGTYTMVGAGWGTPLPLVIRATTEGESVLAAGSLTLPAKSDGVFAERGELSIRVDAGPIGGPYVPAEHLTVFFTPEHVGNRLILRYEGSGGVPAPDTLTIRADGSLRGEVLVPGAATEHVDVVFRGPGTD
jgi:hypothetical protein